MRKHIENTIRHYGEKLSSYDLARFGDIVDPVKIIFDKAIYGYSLDEIIKGELFSQRDRISRNEVDYFHKYIFQYIEGCTVTENGWDVIISRDERIDVPECGKVKSVYAQFVSTYDSLNSAAIHKSRIAAQMQLLDDDDCACFLVEIKSEHSQNIAWEISVDGEKYMHRRIRRVSMDEFYKTVTGQDDAFYQMCMALPAVVEEVVESSDAIAVPHDTVIEELRSVAESKNGSLAMALFMLGFGSYIGFDKK